MGSFSAIKGAVAVIGAAAVGGAIGAGVSGIADVAAHTQKRDKVQEVLTGLGHSRVRWRDPVLARLGEDEPTEANVARIMREFEQT